ncbi:hypothetical protein [Thomasclavelia ramosa]|uniref:hypothetical protein n=1 Tax=Thomasclavelia ramosa TaxID=1547 RepID=UPI003AB9A38E
MIARLGEVSSIFNISEPIMFGLPVVFNPIYTVPFCIISICFNFNSIFCNCSWLSRTYLYCYPMGNSPPYFLVIYLLVIYGVRPHRSL